MIKSKFLLLLIVAIGLFACKKNNSKSISGIFEGQFIAIYPATNDTFLGKALITLSTNGQYNSKADVNLYPAGGSGSFTFNDSIIAFNDVNVWTSNFDFNLVLNGLYKYSYEGSKLNLKLHNTNGNIYQYILLKK